MVVVGVAHAGWPVAAVGGAAAVADHQRDPLGLREEAAGPADVQYFGLPAEDDGDDLGLRREPSGLAGADRFTGVEVRCLQATHEGVEGDQDHCGGGDAAGVGDPVGRVALDELHERPAHPLRTRATRDPGSLGGGLMLGGGEPVQDLGEHLGLGGGQGEPAVGLAVAVVGHREPARLRGLGFLALEDFGFVGVRDVGCDHVQQATPGDPQRPGVEVRGLLDQERLRLRDQTAGPGRRGVRRPQATTTCACSTTSSPVASASRVSGWVSRS